MSLIETDLTTKGDIPLDNTLATKSGTANEESIASVSGSPADSNMHANNFTKKKDTTFVLPSINNENIPRTDLKQKTTNRVAGKDLTRNNLTSKTLGEGHRHKWEREDESEFCTVPDCTALRPIKYDKVGELSIFNENYIQDQFGILYRPVYVGESFTPNNDTLIFENKYYITEGLGNCEFCQGAGKITVENLGLKDCPDCDGTGDVQGDVQGEQPMGTPEGIQPIGEEPEQDIQQSNTQQGQPQVPQQVQGQPEQDTPKKDFSKSGKRPDNLDDFDKEDKEMSTEAEEDSWITMHGNHIKVKKGQTKKQAVSDFLNNVDDDLKESPKKEEPTTTKPKKRFTLKDYEKNEDINDHTKNAQMLVNQYGTPEEKTEMDGIAKRHGADGISNDDYKRRYEISNKYYSNLVKDGKEPEKSSAIPKNWDNMTSDQKDNHMKNNLNKDNFNDFAKNIEKHHTQPKETKSWDDIDDKDISDDTKKFSYKFVRSKHNTYGSTAKQVQIKNTKYDKLKDIDNQIWEENNFSSGKDTYSRDGMSKYKKSLADKLGSKYEGIEKDIQEWLTDDNHHSLNQAIDELRADIKDGEIEDWWDKATKKSRDNLMSTDDDYYKQNHPDKYKTEKYDDLDSISQSSLRARFVSRHTGKEAKLDKCPYCRSTNLSQDKYYNTKCNDCDRNFDNPYEEPDAYEAKLKSGYIKCKKCDQQFSNAQWLLDHMKEIHQSNESFDKVVKACGCKVKAKESIDNYKIHIYNQIQVLKKRARVGESVNLMYGLPSISKQGKKIKGTLAYAGVSLNDRIYLPETLAKGHGKTLPLLLNHSSTAGAEMELYRLSEEMLDHLENERDFQVGEVTLTWDPDKLTLFYEGIIDNEFFQNEVDEMDMAVSLGIYYDSNSPKVCDESCYTLIKGAEFREVSLVYHAGFPIATIEAVEAELKINALRAMEDNLEGARHQMHNDVKRLSNQDVKHGGFDWQEDGEGKYSKQNDDLLKSMGGAKSDKPEWARKKPISSMYDEIQGIAGGDEADAEEITDNLARGGAVDVVPVENPKQAIMAESLSTIHDFSIRGVAGMTISNSNGVERYTLDPSMSYETNMIHFNVAPNGAYIYGEEIQLQPKMTTPKKLTKEIESKPDIKFTDSDEDMFKKKA